MPLLSRKNFTSSTVHTDQSVWRRLEWRPGRRRFGLTVLDRYVFREILVPFSMWLAFFTTLLMSIVIKDVVGDLLGKGLGVGDLIIYLGYLIMEKLVETVPMACLISGIMASGRLSGDSEITAMRSAGISFPRIYSIYIVFGFLAMLMVAFINLEIGPRSVRARESFEEKLKTYHSLSLVQPGRFLGKSVGAITRKGNDIYAEKKTDGILNNVQIREWISDVDDEKSEKIALKNFVLPIGDGFITQIVNAREGELVNRISPDGSEEKVIRLKNGFLIEVNEESRNYEITDFREGYMDYTIPPPARTHARLNVRPDNYTFLELIEFLRKMEEGGNTIDFCSLLPKCDSGSADLKIGESAGGKSSTTMVLPSSSQMEMMLMQQRLWLLKNTSRCGKSDGPTEEECKQHIDLFMILQAYMNQSGKTKLKFEVEVQKRLAVPIACMLFFFISFPLGLVVKRSGRGMSFTLAGFIFVIYYMLVTFGLSRAYQGRIAPAVGAWLPDIVIALIGVYIMSTRTDDFAPFGFLSLPFRFLFRPLGKIGLHLRRKIFAPLMGTRVMVSLNSRFELLRASGSQLMIRIFRRGGSNREQE